MGKTGIGLVLPFSLLARKRYANPDSLARLLLTEMITDN